MSKPTLEQFIVDEQMNGRKSAKKKWWKFSRKKITPEEKRRRKFEGDTRPYSEKNAGHYKTANFLSYFFQVVSISGAIYGAYRMFWDSTPMGAFLITVALVVLWHYEKLARWTSDKFWDEWVAGRYNLKFAFLNFGVIWTIGFALTLGGAYFLLNDVQPAPGDSISVSDPAYQSMEKQVADARQDVRNAEKRVAAFKKDRSNLCKDNGKWVVCYNRRKALSKLDGAIVVAEERLTAAMDEKRQRFGSLKILDDRATAYHLTVVDSRFYVQIGLFAFCLLMFEFCMFYRSKYEIHLYWEDCYARAYGSKPKTEGKRKPKKRKAAKKPSPRPTFEGGVTQDEPVTLPAEPVTEYNEPVTEEDESVTEYVKPVTIPEGHKMCALNGCTNLVTGRKKFCCDSHRVLSYKYGRVPA